MCNEKKEKRNKKQDTRNKMQDSKKTECVKREK